MGILKTQGTKLFIAATFGATKTMSALTNAANAVATLEASHGVTVNDVVEVTSGWSGIDKIVARASVVATNDVTLEGVSTLNTADYPAGTGIGSVREVLTWVELTQLKPAFGSSGGGMEFGDGTFLTSKRRQKYPTLPASIDLEFKFFYDPALAWLATVRTAARAQIPTPYYMLAPSGAKMYGNAYWGLQDQPAPEDGSFAGTVTLSIQTDVINYAS